jgi:hypothetical protein
LRLIIIGEAKIIETISIGMKACLHHIIHCTTIENTCSVYIARNWFNLPGTASLLSLIRYSKRMNTSLEVIKRRILVSTVKIKNIHS